MEKSQLVITKTFKSNAGFADVRQFYSQQLIPKGWNFVQERAVKHKGRIRGEQLMEFTKDNYRLVIQFAGQLDAVLGWNYAVSLSPLDYRKDKIF